MANLFPFCPNPTLDFAGKLTPCGRPDSIVKARFIGNQSMLMVTFFYSHVSYQQLLQQK